MSDCKGCQIINCFFKSTLYKRKIAARYIEICPCRTCLVKVICKISCEDYDKEANKLIAIIQEKGYDVIKRV